MEKNHDRASPEMNVILIMRLYVNNSTTVLEYDDVNVYSVSVWEESPLQELFQNVGIVRCEYIYGVRWGYQNTLWHLTIWTGWYGDR